MDYIKAKDILNLLYKKHSKDVCISECKTGPTWHSLKCPRLDFVAFTRSYSKPFVCGYEIKISRQDFLKDNKWTQYLNYCTDFYFVCPPGIIDKNELPKEAGLLITSKNIKNLYIKKKAPSRQIEIPIEMYKYIIISRTDIKKENYNHNNKKYWQDWLVEKDEKKQIGYNVSKKIRTIIEERIDKVDHENRRVRAQIKTLEDVKTFLLKMGFNEDQIKNKSSYYFENKLFEKIKEIETGIPMEFNEILQTTLQSLNKLSDLIKNTSPR